MGVGQAVLEMRRAGGGAVIANRRMTVFLCSITDKAAIQVMLAAELRERLERARIADRTWWRLRDWWAGFVRQELRS